MRMFVPRACRSSSGATIHHVTETRPNERDQRLRSRLERLDPFWAPQLLIGAAILLQLSLSEQVTIGPRWLLPGLEAIALGGLALSAPHPRLRHSPLRRRLSLAIIGLVSAANSISLVLLCRLLVDGSKATGSGRPLIGSGMVLWTTNVLLFTVWYWQLDRGGPVARGMQEADRPDFAFVQMLTPEIAPPNWEPSFVDYFYLSFTNATAFSPTDTMPLTAEAKLLMTGQSITALVTIGLVISRAVNILG